MAFELGDERARLAGNPILDLRWQVLVGKVDRSLEMGENAGEAIAPAPIKVPELALELAQGLAALRFGLGRGEIGDGFGL